MAPSPGPIRHSLTLPAELSQASRVRQLVAEAAAEAGFSEERCFDIQVASSEACANAIEHSPPEASVAVEVLVFEDRLEITIEGHGQFELPAVAAREHTHRGLGLPLMAKLSDHLALYSGPRGGTLVALTFYRPGFRDEYAEDVMPPSIAALLEDNELVAAITDTAPVGLCVIDPQLRFRWANPAYRQFLEEPYRSQSLEGVFVGDAVPGAEERGSLDVLLTVSRSGERAFFPEYELVGFARGITFWRWEALPLERERSEPPYDVLVVISEITEQVEQRRRLDALATEAGDRAGQLQSVLDASAVAIWVAHDPECRVITGNLYAEQVVMGVPTGGNISRSALPGTADVVYTVWRDGRELKPDELPAQIAARTAQPVFDQEFELRFLDGRTVHMLANALPVFDADGRVRGSVTAALDVTERRRAEEEARRLLSSLQVEKERLARLIDSITDEVWFADTEKRFTIINAAAIGELGIGFSSAFTVEELVNATHVYRPDMTPRPVEEAPPLRALAGEVVRNQEEVVRKPSSQELRYRLVNATPVRDAEGDIVGAVSVVRDITERRQAEGDLVKVNRILKALSESNRALVRTTDESTYLDEACRIVAEDCGYSMVWIGYAENDEVRSVRPVASAGFEDGYLETLNITWADAERGRGPTGTAIRTGRPCLCRNMLTDPSFIPWRGAAIARGYASSVVLPLVADELPFGAINIYSAEPDSFSEDEVRLLTDVAADIARGITSLRLRAAQVRAEEERERLLVQEKELAAAARDIAERRLAEEGAIRASQYNRSLIEAALDPLVTIGPDGKITDVNEATIKVTGRAREELIGTDFSDYFTDRESARQGYREVFATGSVTDYPLTIRDRTGKLTDVLYNASVYKDRDGHVLGVFAAARDITALRELEMQREIASKLQEALLDIPQDLSGLKFGHLYRSATKEALVGGDFYDVFKVKNDRIAVLIGDVSGHGVEAARVATLVKDVVHAFAHHFTHPQMVLAETNDLLIEKRSPGFVTVFLGVLDPDAGSLTYSSAGHPNALIRTFAGEVELLEARSAPVGVFPGYSWKDSKVQLRTGDLLLLYTDGAVEARRNGDFFGQEGLVKALERWSDPSPERLPEALLAEILAFSGGELTDDVAMLALGLTGERPGDER